jgi:hypothetical protein
MHEDVQKKTFRTRHGHYEFKVMSFSLTNAPTIFQALMNHILEQLLSKFVRVFFNDILKYNFVLKLYINYLKMVLETLKDNQLFVKQSKCIFYQQQMEYIGHIILLKGNH